MKEKKKKGNREDFLILLAGIEKRITWREG